MCCSKPHFPARSAGKMSAASARSAGKMSAADVLFKPHSPSPKCWEDEYRACAVSASFVSFVFGLLCKPHSPSLQCWEDEYRVFAVSVQFHFPQPAVLGR